MMSELSTRIDISADFSSTTHATLTMSPEDLAELIALTRYLTWDVRDKVKYGSRAWSTLVNVANVSIPADLK